MFGDLMYGIFTYGDDHTQDNNNSPSLPPLYIFAAGDMPSGDTGGNY